MNKEIAAALRNDFKSFVIKVFHEVAANSSYLDNWHIDVICHNIEQVINGNKKKLIINVPPRYMKSIICSVALPAFLLGNNPKENIICVSYSDDLAAKMAFDCKRVIESYWYQEIFPATKILSDRRSISDFETTKGGGRFSTSVNATLTGRGGDIIIVDDPISPKDSNSDTMREKTNDWYGNTLVSRLNNKNVGKVIVIMQRTHEVDFTGHLLEIDPAFELIKMPAIAEEDETWETLNLLGNKKIFTRKVGEALHPARESLAGLKEIQNNMGNYNFTGQYQQNPTSRGGNLVKREYLKFYNLTKLENDMSQGRIVGRSICQSWDTASKAEEHNDYSVCITYLLAYNRILKRHEIYILDVFRAKLEMPELIKKAVSLKEEMKNKYRRLANFQYILIEEMNSGIGLSQVLRNNRYIVIPISPMQDKPTRLKNILHLIENGTVLFSDDKPAWWEIFEREVITFPNSKHDDQCDSLSQLLTHEANTNLRLNVVN
ncbi:MAG: phage terminase large subunit [Endomicrobia bacterium]|nr:phage terminase large subunit [Endomicrobiia bacterium]